jgi:brefeldin A-inhibited guanine nucleotide-exchange protein
MPYFQSATPADKEDEPLPAIPPPSPSPTPSPPPPTLVVEPSTTGTPEEEEVNLEEDAPPAPPAVSSPEQPPSRTATVADTESVTRTRSSTLSSSRSGVPPLLSGVLIISSLESLLNTKEAKRNAPFKQAITTTLDLLRNPDAMPLDPRAVFEPLRLACESDNYPIMITALDCIGKLVSQGGFGAPLPASVLGSRRQSSSSLSSPEPGTDSSSAFLPIEPAFADEVVNTVCGCFVDSPSGTAVGSEAEKVNLHLISALMSLILSSSLPVHQTALLKSVRTVYNVFLLSRAHQNQMVAQAALGQIVGAVFGRVQTGVTIRKGESMMSLGSMSSHSSKVDVGDMAAADDIEAASRGSVETVREAQASSSAAPNGEGTSGQDAAKSVQAGEEPSGAVAAEANGHDLVPSDEIGAEKREADNTDGVNGTTEPEPIESTEPTAVTEDSVEPSEVPEEVKPHIGPSVPVDLRSDSDPSAVRAAASSIQRFLKTNKRSSTDGSEASVPNGPATPDEEKVTL